jgi:Do/DeqQ family serine protease
LPSEIKKNKTWLPLNFINEFRTAGAYFLKLPCQQSMNMKNRFLTLVASVLAGFAGAAVFFYSQSNSGHYAPAATYNAPARVVNFTPDGGPSVSFEPAAELTVHSVVHIKTYGREDSFNNQFQGDPFFNFFFDNRQRYNPDVPSGSGSGVIVSENGYVVTNNHVIQGVNKIEVVLNNRKTYVAELVGTDPTTDLALLKIEEKNLPYLTYGNSDDVKVGQWVLAVGNPFNLTSTVTAGIVSAKGRNINVLEGDPNRGMFPIESFIQTDAAVNPGNSGGALVNTRGELVGINSAIASNTGSYAGYSFAIPVNMVKKVIKDLLEFGTVQRAYIGVSIRDIDNRLAEEKGIKEFKGVYVSGITDDGAAANAGIQEGDIIMKVGDSEVNSSPELQEQVGKYRPGDKVEVTVMRDAKAISLPVILKNKNNTTTLFVREKEKVNQGDQINFLGATFSQVSDEEKIKLRIRSGLKILKLSAGKLASSGIKEGFIITSVDKRPINSPEDLKFLETKKGGVLIEGVYPNGFRAYYGFGL